MSKTLKVGSVIPVPIGQEHIDASIPCDKDHCMLTMAGIDLLTKRFGNRNYRVRSTNHGMQFDINGYRILTVFDHKTGEVIYKYDEVYTKTKNQQKAKSVVRPFKAKLMVESCQKIPTFAPMSEEKKAELRKYAKEHPRARSVGVRSGGRRKIAA